MKKLFVLNEYHARIILSALQVYYKQLSKEMHQDGVILSDETELEYLDTLEKMDDIEISLRKAFKSFV